MSDGVIGSDRIASLDGLRSVAVVVVIAFHCGLPRLNGGFIGVDVFFVLSGFVITRRMLSESNRGIHLVGFWAGRAARLLPAAILTVALTCVAFAFVATPIERADVRGDAFSALFYVANWRYIAESTAYFRDSVAASPFLHMWSLSVEEQFYLAWPVVMTVVLAMAPARSPRRVLAVVGGLAALATAWFAYASTHFSAERVYYGTDARAYQLLAGAVVATAFWARGSASPRLSGRASVGVPTGLAGIVLAVVADLDPSQRGAVAAASTLCVIVPVAGGTEGPVGRVLGTRPFVLVGRVSYGMYLCHWPIIVVMGRIFVIGPNALLAFTLAASFVLGYASHQLVERPAVNALRRLGDRPRASLTAIGVGVSTTALVAVAAVPLALGSSIPVLAAAPRPGFTPAPGATAARDLPMAATPVPPDLGRIPLTPFPNDGACINHSLRPEDTCQVTTGERLTVLLLGDSHAGDLQPLIALLAETYGLQLHTVVTAGCPWRSGLRYVEFDSRTCHDVNAELPGLLQRVDPDVLILADHPMLEPGFAIERRASEAPGGLADLAIVRDETLDTIQRFQAPDRRIVVVEPRPSAPFDVPSCLSAASTVEECAFVAEPHALNEAQMLRNLATSSGTFTSVEMIDVVCPRYPVCDPIVRGALVRYDRDHLYGAFVQALGDDFLERTGLVDAP